MDGGAVFFVAVVGFCLSVPAISNIGVARQPADCCMNIASHQQRDHRACITWCGKCVLCSAPVAGGVVHDFYPPGGLVLFASCLERAIEIIWPYKPRA